MAAYGFKDAVQLKMVQHKYFANRYVPIVSANKIFVESFKQFDLDNTGLFNHIFSEVRFDKVRWRCFPSVNTHNNPDYNSPNFTLPPSIHSLLNIYGANPGSLNTAIHAPSYRRHNQFKPFQRTVIPALSTDVDAATGIGTVMLHGEYATEAEQNALWYGLVIITGGAGASQTSFPAWSVWATYYLSFRFGGY